MFITQANILLSHPAASSPSAGRLGSTGGVITGGITGGTTGGISGLGGSGVTSGGTFISEQSAELKPFIIPLLNEYSVM